MLSAALSRSRASVPGLALGPFATRWAAMSTKTIKGQVGVVGLGNMGAPMARNALKHCESVVVLDLNASVVDSLVKDGAVAAKSVKDFAGCHTVLTSLPGNPQVQGVYQGPGGLLEVMPSGTVFVDSSTISPMLTRQLADVAKKGGSSLFDAPVSGGVPGAVAGTLTFMVGASEEELAVVKPFLSTMGKNIVACGAVGNGQVAKLCNNLVLGISMIAVAEGMNLGGRLGMDQKILANIFNTSTARCWSSDTYNPCPGVMEGVPASRNFDGGFGVDLMLKDLGLALQAGMDVKQPMVGTGMASQVYSLLSAQGFGHKDFGYVYEMFHKK